MSYPELGVNEVIDLGSSPEATRLVASMTTWLGGDLATLRRDYGVRWTEGDPAVAVLVPRDAALASMFSEIRLSLAQDPVRIDVIEVFEPGGDRVEIKLSDIVQDPVLGPGTFALPEGLR